MVHFVRRFLRGGIAMQYRGLMLYGVLTREERSQVAREGHRKAEFGRETSRATVSVEKKVTLLVDHPKRHSQKSYQKKGGE